MTRAEVLEVVVSTLRNYVSYDHTITEETLLRSDLNLESLSAIDAVLELERILDVSLRDDAVYTARTVGDLVNMVMSAAGGERV